MSVYALTRALVAGLPAVLAWLALRAVPCLLLLAPHLPAQQMTSSERTQTAPTVYSADELQTTFFTPEHARAQDLDKVVGRLYGRSLLVAGRDGRFADNIQELGDSLLIYDTPEYSQRVLAALAQLDQQLGRSEQARSSQEPELRTVEWTPRCIPLNTALQALEPFQRTIFPKDAYGASQKAPNLSVARDRSLLVLRDAPAAVEEMLGVLGRIDVPAPQLVFECLVVVAHREQQPGMTAPPTELTSHLARLVPFENFNQVAFGLVRTSARSDEIELSMDGEQRLQLRPVAYDAQGGSLTTEIEYAWGGQRFQTRTTIALGEYTVVGATGADPVFVALRIRPSDG